MGERVIAYVHDPRCSWVSNCATCDCGLDEAYTKALHDEAVKAADELLARAEKAEATIARIDQKMLEYVRINEVVKRSSIGATGPTMWDQIRAALDGGT